MYDELQRCLKNAVFNFSSHARDEEGTKLRETYHDGLRIGDRLVGQARCFEINE